MKTDTKSTKEERRKTGQRILQKLKSFDGSRVNEK